MEASQIELLFSLAKEINTQKRNKTKVRETLKSAKILKSTGKFYVQYGNLEKVVVPTK